MDACGDVAQVVETLGVPGAATAAAPLAAAVQVHTLVVRVVDSTQRVEGAEEGLHEIWIALNAGFEL